MHSSRQYVCISIMCESSVQRKLGLDFLIPHGIAIFISQFIKQLEKKVLEFGAQLVVIDTAADTFGGHENARRDVRMFIGQLNKLALKINGAVVLCAHPSVSGMVSGRGDGGNTAWNNSVRSRLYLHRPEADKDALPVDANIRLLSRKKSNYSAANDELTLLWQNGVFITLGAAGGPGDALTMVQRDKLSEECFLKALDDYAVQERPLSCGKTSSNYAPKVMMKSPHCAGFSKKELEAQWNVSSASARLKMRPMVVGTISPRRFKNGRLKCV